MEATMQPTPEQAQAGLAYREADLLSRALHTWRCTRTMRRARRSEAPGRLTIMIATHREVERAVLQAIKAGAR